MSPELTEVIQRLREQVANPVRANNDADLIVAEISELQGEIEQLRAALDDCALVIERSVQTGFFVRGEPISKTIATIKRG